MHHSPYRHSLGAEPVPSTTLPGPRPPALGIPDLLTLPTPRVSRRDYSLSPTSTSWDWIRDHHEGTMISPWVPRRFNPNLTTAAAIAQGSAVPRPMTWDPAYSQEEMSARGYGVEGRGAGAGLGNPLTAMLPTIWDATMFGVGAGVGNAASEWLIEKYTGRPTGGGVAGRIARGIAPSPHPGLGQEVAKSLTLSSLQTAPMIVGGFAASGATWATSLIPVIGPIVAGVTIGLSLLWNRKGPKQKVATTAVVDQVEPLLKENVAGYLSGPHTQSSQRQALANFDAGWAWVVDHCDIPEMGDPGQRCVSERQAGGRWDWFALYRTPIANDPGVRPDPQGTTVQTVAVTDPVTGQVTYRQVAVPAAGGGDDMTPLLIGAAILAAAFLFMGEG